MLKKKTGRLKKKPKVKAVTIKRSIPLTSEEHYEETRTAINKLNRNRSKIHERRIAALLHGKRVPMSGAMSEYKGDVVVEYSDGKYMVECKLSSAITSDNSPVVLMLFKWLPKLQFEASLQFGMNFGIFVIHFHSHDILDDITLIRAEDLEMIMMRYPSATTEIVRQVYYNCNTSDIQTTKKGKLLLSYQLKKKHIERDMLTIAGISGVKLHTPNGIYFAMRLRDFRDLTANM